MSTSSPSDERVLAAIAEEAGAWYEQNRSGPLNSDSRAGFIAWLRASPVHVQEYLGVAMVAGDLPVAANDPAVSLDSLLAEAHAASGNVVSLIQPSPARGTTRPRLRGAARSWAIAMAASAAGVAILSIALWATRTSDRLELLATYATEHGEQRLVRLPDGSALHLNTDTQVIVRYTGAERFATVNQGEAVFQVAHDSQRRFRVGAGEAGVLAIGTQFDVYRHSKAVTITVVEGTVAVFIGAPPPPQSTNPLPPAALRLDAGYQVEVNRRISAPRPVDTRSATAWLQRQIAFRDRPLGEVADEFNRYGRTIIEIDDPDLRAMPISGVFDAYDADSFAAFLATLTGVAVQNTPTGVLVQKLPPTSR